MVEDGKVTSAKLDRPITLRGVLARMEVRDLFRGDLLVGLGGAAGGAWLAVADPTQLRAAVPSAVVLIGVVIGAIVAGVAIMATFLNPAFLRKMRAIDEDPVHYLSPFLLTGLTGTVAALLSIVLSALPETCPPGLLDALGGVTGATVLYALASTAPNMTSLIRFIRLQEDAAEVPDDLPEIGPRGRGSQTG